VVKHFSDGVNATDKLHNIGNIVFADQTVHTPGVTQLTKSSQTYSVGGYSVENNDWGAGTLEIGKDFTQSISFNDNSLQSGIVMTWSYPEAQSLAAAAARPFRHVAVRPSNASDEIRARSSN
jgi:hypothetical protein